MEICISASTGGAFFAQVCPPFPRVGQEWHWICAGGGELTDKLVKDWGCKIGEALEDKPSLDGTL